MKRISHTKHSLLRSVIAALLALVCFASPLLVASAYAAGWYCPSCGRYNDNNFCPKDGTRKPSDLESNAKGSGLKPVKKGHGVLRSDYELQSGSGEAGPTYDVFGSSISKESIASIKFLRSLAGAPKDAWDVSEARDRSVLAWVTPVGNYGMYDLSIAGDGGVWAPEDCSYLFACYRWANSLDFNNAFFVSGCRTMRGMFVRDEFITELDFSGWDTSTVTDMSKMFCFCSSLADFDLRHLNTSSVTNMSFMFSRFGGTDTLDLSCLDTSSVTDMSNMFFQSWGLKDLNLSSFDTSSVKSSEGFLWGPLELENLTVGPKFDRKILINSAKTNLFMVENGTINGQPWRTFLYG